VATSLCEPHRAFIEAQLRLGRNATAIYQDLVDAHGFAGRYNSVKRFVARIRVREPEQFDRLSFLPGEEMQVDFGEGAPTRVPGTDRWRKPRLFVATLRYSRRSFRRVVWNSGQQVWAELHEQAWRYFGGSCRYVVLDNLKELKNQAKERDLTPREQKELSDEEKEYKSKRKLVQEKLIKFATRVPIFMYLTDYRERTLRDVITKLEPALFKKVTGLTTNDFERLVSLDVFNSALMNDAVYKFKRYEDGSLAYAGVNKHEGEAVGLYDTVLSPTEYGQVFENQAEYG